MKAFFTLMATCLLLTKTMAQPNYLSLLKDINPAGSSNAHGIIEMNGVYYFNAFTSNEGFELWRTDATTAGTYLVKDINPGIADGSTGFYPVKMNNKIYFPGTNAINGSELWSSDGTAAGTQMVKDINPGITGSYIFQMTVYNNKIYFVTNSSVYGDELWSSDGTEAGTQIVKDINPGAGSSGISLSALNIVNDKLVFTATDGTNGSRLWSSDGTAAGTKMISPTMNVYNIIGGGSATMNNNIYFPATIGGTALWKSDGTAAGTVKVADIVSVTGGTGISLPTTVGNNIFFKVGTKELWKSDGTATGTVLVKNMESVSLNGTFSPFYMYAYDDNTLIFTCNYSYSWETNPWGCELWKSDGTNAGTSLVKSFTTLNGSVGVTPNGFTKYNGRYYFMAYSTSGYYELWKTDATPGGTVTVRSSSGLDGSYPEGITVANGLMYYITWGASNSNNYGFWQSDGTSAGTQKITESGNGCLQKPSSLIVYPTKAILFATAIENFTGNYYGEEPFITNIPVKPACTSFQTPTINITSNVVGGVCPGAPIIFNATITNGGTVPIYQWKRNGVNISWAVGATCSLNSLNNSDTISCVLTSNADCVTSATAASNKIIVSIYPTPVPTIAASGPLTFCEGGSVILTSSVASSYLWSNGATTRSITVNTTGTYSVIITSNNGCKGSSVAKIITVNPLPVASITSSGLTTFCQGGNVLLTASSASSYLWNNGATTPAITVNATGNYSVTITNINGCSASSGTTPVTVNSLPVPTVTAGGPTTFCAGGSVSFTSTPAVGYTWYNELNQPQWFLQTFTATTAGTYHVVVLDANGCEGSSTANTFTTNPLPEPVITAGGPTTFCQGGSVILTAPDGYSSYLWSNGAATKSIVVNTNGNYSVTVTNTNGCAGISNQIFVLVNTLPVPIITANGPLSFCQGGSVKLTANNGYSSYLWSNGAATKSITVKTANNYTVTVTNTVGCTGTSTVKTVTVNPLPVPTVTASGPTTFCQGGSVLLTSSTASNYLWSTGAKTQSIIVNSAGNYSVSVTNANGCTGSSAITKVTVNPIPQPTITTSGPTTFCNGSNVKLTASINGTYLWSNGATTKTITVTTAGNYNVNVTTNGCSGTSSNTKVIVNPVPSVTVTASGAITNLCPGATVTLNAGSGFSTYLWSNGATTQSIIVTAAGNYTVTVTNTSGCSTTSSITKVTYLTCSAPIGLKATVTSATAATLKWNTANCGTNYQVQYKPVGAASFITTTTSATSIGIANLLPGTTYQWQVATICQSSPLILSANTAGANFTTPAALSTVNAPVVVNHLNAEQSFNAIVFPNPAKNTAVVRLSGNENEVVINITDISGKLLWKSMKIKDQQVTLPIEKFANGMYIITVNNGKEIKVLKLIKE